MSLRARRSFSVFLGMFLCPFCFLLLGATSSHAWDDGGHMLVAQIASSRLSANAKRNVNLLLKHLPDVRNGNPRPYDFLTAACWMDDMRSAPEYSQLRSLHYIDVPSNGGVSAAKMPNALTALDSCRKTLRDKRPPLATRAIALAMVMHIVGDLHQPLHCVERDVGGNTFPISGVPDLEPRLRRDGKSVDRDLPPVGENAPVYQRLHAFWDAAYRYEIETKSGNQRLVKRRSLGRSSRPATERISQLAAKLSAQYSSSPQNTNDAAVWALEGKGLCDTFVFRTPRAQRPSMAYFQRSHDVACRQLALAGYRLALVLNAIYAA